MSYLRTVIFALVALGFSTDCFTQTIEPRVPDWATLMYTEMEQEVSDPQLVVDAYENFYESNPFVKNRYIQDYKRWIRGLGRERALQNSDGAGLEVLRAEEENYLKRSATNSTTSGSVAKSGMAANWSCMGPFDFDIDAAGVSYAPGAAHVYTIERSATNPDRLLAGTATAGLFRSTDKGLNWVPLTENLMVNQILAVEIDPTNEFVSWFGGNGSVYKSTDGGDNWTQTGSVLFNSEYHTAKEILCSGLSPTIVHLATNKGLYYSSDAGLNWAEQLDGDFQEIEIHPTNPNILYTVKQISNKTEFWKSTDGGLNWTIKPTGWPSPAAADEQKRTEIAVSAAAPSIVYAMTTGEANGGSGLYGMYKSTDEGESWNFICCGGAPGGVPTASNPNIMHWDADGQTSGGQYYYDMALAVSPSNAQELYTGGVNIWKSTDGGVNFINNAHWTLGSAGSRYVHADVQDIRTYGNEIWVASDGGIYFSTDGGNSFEKRMNGIAGTDFWGFGTGFSDGQVMLGGTYHNATLVKDNDVYNSGWMSTVGGDNYRGFVNFGNPRQVYHDGGQRILPGDRALDFGYAAFSLLPNASYIIGESSTIAFHPSCHNILWLGNAGGLYKSENNGGNFELLKDFGAGKVTAVEISWSNPDRIYLAYYPGWWDTKQIWRSDDAGTTWTEITPSSAQLNGNTWAPYDLAVASDNPDEIWMLRTPQSSSYNNLDGYKVFQSLDGGTTWVNKTDASLDGEYPSNIEFQRGTNSGVYIGTRRAVYYKNASMPTWDLFNAGLPVSTFSTKLVIDYRNGKIRNGTNRSVWESDLYESTAPSAQIASDKIGGLLQPRYRLLC